MDKAWMLIQQFNEFTDYEPTKANHIKGLRRITLVNGGNSLYAPNGAYGVKSDNTTVVLTRKEALRRLGITA